MKNDLITDKKKAMEEIKKDGYNIKYVSPYLQDDPEIVLLAMEEEPDVAIEYASPRLKNDSELVMRAVQSSSYGAALAYAGDIPKNDKDIVLTAIRKNPMRVQDASPRLKKDLDVCLEVARLSTKALYFVDFDFIRNSKEFREYVDIYRKPFSDSFEFSIKKPIPQKLDDKINIVKDKFKTLEGLLEQEKQLNTEIEKGKTSSSRKV